MRKPESGRSTNFPMRCACNSAPVATDVHPFFDDTPEGEPAFLPASQCGIRQPFPLSWDPAEGRGARNRRAFCWGGWAVGTSATTPSSTRR